MIFNPWDLVWGVPVAFLLTFGPLWLSFTYYDHVEHWILKELGKGILIILGIFSLGIVPF